MQEYTGVSNTIKAWNHGTFIRWMDVFRLRNLNMSCECKELPQIFNVERYPSHLSERLEVVDQKDEGWVKLYKCFVCSEYWQVDKWDKYQTVCAIKILAPDSWHTFDDKPPRLHSLVNSRGGLSEEDCVMARCKNKALKSLAYCPVHAYETGLRE